MSHTRRSFLSTAAAAPIALAAGPSRAVQVAPITEGDEAPPPKYDLAMNLEIMFPREMPYHDRLREVARCGAKHYGFWSYQNKDLDALLDVQREHGLTCVSITGANRTGWSTGLTQPGEEAAFLDDFEGACEVARRFGAKNLITFVGRVQPDVPWQQQEEQIISGLKQAGPIAERYDVVLALEPLNRVESPQMTMLTSDDAFRYAEAADHPRVKVDYDMYHRQLGEGNVINKLVEGLERGLIAFVEVGDVPGRKEPGTGETNYVNIFHVLRELNYEGAVGMEHGTTRTPQHAWEVVRRMAGLA